MITLRKALGLLRPEQRARLLWLVPIALLASGFEVLGAALVYVLLGLIANPAGEVSLPVIGDFRELFVVDQDVLLLGLAAVMAIFFAIRAVVHVGQLYVQNRVVHNLGARLARRLVTGYLLMPYAFHLQRNSSELIRNSHQAVRELESAVFKQIVRVMAEAIMIIGMLVLLVVLAPAATALAVLVIGGAAVLLLTVVQPRLKRLGRVAHQMDKETLGSLQQSFHGIRDVKILGRERAFARVYGRSRSKLARALYLRSTLADLPRTLIETALIAFILVFFTVVILTGDGAEGVLSVLGLFAYAGLRLQPSLHAIISGLNNLKYASAPIDDLYADLHATAAAIQPDDEVPALPFQRALRLEDVSFRYEGAHRSALERVTLTIHPGEVIGVCGPTGGGKTTLVDVMTGLLAPTEGRVTVDDHDLREHARRWQRNLGVVPQMVFLTDDSVRGNIALGVSRDDIDDDALEQAVDLAQLRQFVSSLPDCLDTIVGERGVRVSGGQRQRIAIARALYRRPKVLIFDEGTSALDNTTERELMGALERLRGNHTILMIAHRLSTVRDADRIVFVQDGRITALGTYDDLIATHPEFRSLAST